jgi:hypothetical protein
LKLQDNISASLNQFFYHRIPSQIRKNKPKKIGSTIITTKYELKKFASVYLCGKPLYCGQALSCRKCAASEFKLRAGESYIIRNEQECSSKNWYGQFGKEENTRGILRLFLE